MNVDFYATFRQIVGSKTVDFPLPQGSTLRQLIAEIIRCYPPLRQELLDKNDELYRHVHVFVNGRDAPFLENGLDTVLTTQDTVSLFPAVGGGKEPIWTSEVGYNKRKIDPRFT